LFFALFAAATPSPVFARGSGNSGQCNTGPIQCCNSVENVSFINDITFRLSGFLGSLGILGPITGQIGLNCNPITGIGAGLGPQCTSQPVCCTDAHFNGLINVGCSPINI
ncbi:hypothetical protein SERLA73DRAFT_17726, partial [Serpula lacrymans var. lacrymans S7.3]